MNCPAALALACTMALTTATARSEPVILWTQHAPPPNTTLQEDLRMSLSNGSFVLEVNQQAMRGNANAAVHDRITRHYVSDAEQRIDVVESTRNIRLGLGDSKGSGVSEPKDSTGHLLGKKLAGKKTGQHWTYSLAGGKEPDAAEASALKQFAGYCEAIESLGHLYGTEPRNVGDTWKPDVGAVKLANPEIDASLECKLEDLKAQDGDTVARISVTGRLSAKLTDKGILQLAINGIIHRSLRDMIDLDTEVNGNFRYAGQFGKSGSRAEIVAPVHLTRTVRIVKP